MHPDTFHFPSPLCCHADTNECHGLSEVRQWHPTAFPGFAPARVAKNQPTNQRNKKQKSKNYPSIIIGLYLLSHTFQCLPLPTLAPDLFRPVFFQHPPLSIHMPHALPPGPWAYQTHTHPCQLSIASKSFPPTLGPRVSFHSVEVTLPTSLPDTFALIFPALKATCEHSAELVTQSLPPPPMCVELPVGRECHLADGSERLCMKTEVKPIEVL